MRQAIFDANNQAGADIIRFQAGLSGTINLSVVGDTTAGASALRISSPITIEGNPAGITIRRSPAAPDMRLFRITSAGSLTLESLSLTGGVARAPSDTEGRGGAIYNDGELEIISSTLYGNHAIGGNAAAGIYGERGVGGAIYNNGGDVLLENATLSGNIAESGTGPTVLSSFGGGIYSQNGSLSIYNSTITNSTASTGRGVYLVNTGATVDVRVYSSIIAQSDAPAFALDFLINSEPGDGTTVSGANNLIRTQTLYHQIVVSTEDPLLGTLTNNGGPTMTHGLSNESPAINEGANPRSLTTDQRGPSHARVAGGQADIGAFEVQSAVGPGLIGDYNGNGTVDAADYVLWRKTLGSQVPQSTGADGNGDGTINTADYTVWRNNFGDEDRPETARTAFVERSFAVGGFPATAAARHPIEKIAPEADLLQSYTTAHDEALLILLTEHRSLLARDEHSIGVIRQESPTDAGILLGRMDLGTLSLLGW